MNRRRAWSSAALLVAAAIGWVVYRGAVERRRAALPPPPPVSRFLNAAPGTQYVGTQACAACHAAEFQSWQKTAPGLALADIGPAQEPPDAEFTHDASGRSYRIYRKDGKLRHQEFVKLGESELVLADHAMRYVMGSGRFARSYLVEDRGFFVESPATWYRSRPGWALSPGFDPHNLGFERPTEIQCVHCHVGQVSSIEGSPHRLEIHDQAISCERCHGPGELHAARWKAGTPGTGSADDTIVHPGRLDRELKEAVCAQCHLQSAASIEIRGRGITSFRPGVPLTAIRVDYGFEDANRSMEVTGHVEQMRMSRCYQASDSLTCTTCHHPHASPDANEAQAYYRARCLTCHGEQNCKLPLDARSGQAPGDNCIACHMPQVPTDIPHMAFTHHRIGIHKAGEHPPRQDMPGTLVPLYDVSQLSELERDRCLGLAYVHLLSNPDLVSFNPVYEQRARTLLEAVKSKGVQDGELESALAGLYWQHDSEKAVAHAKAALAAPDLSENRRARALLVLAISCMQMQQYEQASPILEQLVRTRRVSDAWSELSVCREHAGDLPAALESIQEAARISPQRPDFQQRMAHVLARMGKTSLAEAALDRARKLASIRPPSP